MNLKELKKLHIADTAANIAARLEKKLQPISGIAAARGIIFPEAAKNGGLVLMVRDRKNIRRTAFSLLAACGADEDVLKTIGGLHAAGKAALICSVLDKLTAGRLFAPRGVKDAAAAYLAELKRQDYAATWHNLSVNTDMAYRFNYAQKRLNAADKSVTDSISALEKRRTARDEAEKICYAAAADVKLAQARAAAELGDKIAALQEEVEAEEVA